MIAIDYKVVTTVLSGLNSSQSRTIYTTEYPCLMWLEIDPGQLPGFNQPQVCYFDITYTGDRNTLVRTYIWGNQDGGAGDNVRPGTVVGYCPRSGIPVVFKINDDDYSGIVKLHVMRLPQAT